MKRPYLSNLLRVCRDSEEELLHVLRDQPIDLAKPSVLPGWDRAHVIAHLAGNASALTNLMVWAASGDVTPMYASPSARQAQIENDSTKEPARLLEQLYATSALLLDAMQSLPANRWDAEVKTATGRTVAASEVPWMRVRETSIHLVDLDVGVQFSDLAAGLIDNLLDDVTTSIGSRPECPPVVLRATDHDREWRLGPKGTADAPEVAATAADLLEWVLGRPIRPGSSLSNPVVLPRWL